MNLVPAAVAISTPKKLTAKEETQSNNGNDNNRSTIEVSEAQS